MAINSVSPGSYNSPSVQPLAQTQRVPEKVKEASSDEKLKTPPPERPSPSLNTSGQAVGTLLNTKA
ncbi:MAG: hypothetical protein WCI39_10460 [Gallionellaceae bacterium]